MSAMGRRPQQGRRAEATGDPLDGEDALERRLSDLQAAWGIHFPAVAVVLRALASGRPVPMQRLVLDSGLSHRSVAGVTRQLEPWLRVTPDGHMLLPAARPLVEARVGSERASPDSERDGTLALVTRLVDGAPSRRRELDHVAATPDTCLRRARFLARTYALSHAHVLLLGDHDLTSLALAMLEPEARISVVDLDDRLLEYVDRSARRLGHRVTCYFADLRLGLPGPLRESVDIAFTDPPYTPEGVRLFAARACQALRPNDLSRLLLCYGYGERQPALAYKVQRALQALRLVFEAIHPHFSRYVGAQAIGSSSALYLLRPTGGTWKALEHDPAAGARIYSQGGMSLEASPRRLPEQIEWAARAAAGGSAEPVALAGDGWSGEDAEGSMGLPDLWRLYERHATSLPDRRPRVPDTVVVNLIEAPELTARLLLVNRSRRLVAVTAAGQADLLVGPAAPLAPLFLGAYRLREVHRHRDAAVVEATARDHESGSAGRIASHLARHPAAALGNALREAMVRASEAAGRPLTKNQARAALGRHDELEEYRDARAADLPLHVLARLAALVPTLAAEVDEAAARHPTGDDGPGAGAGRTRRDP